VTLDEWEHIADRFQNATHHREKALHKLLTTSIVPSVVQYLGVCDFVHNFAIDH
jgi:hypothetical protein